MTFFVACVYKGDTIFNLNAYRCAQAVCFTGNTDYRYRKEQQTSITQTFSQSKKIAFVKFLTTLHRMAEQENDNDCNLRVKRTAINYCRLYVRMLGNTNLSLKNKRKIIYDFMQNQEMLEFFKGYPLKYLPIQQRIFHMLLLHKRYRTVFWLDWLRGMMRKGAALIYENKKK